MKIIREYAIDKGICVIRTETYTNTLEHFENLFTEAKKDFPELESKDVSIVQFGGEYFKNMFGIVF